MAHLYRFQKRFLLLGILFKIVLELFEFQHFVIKHILEHGWLHFHPSLDSSGRLQDPWRNVVRIYAPSRSINNLLSGALNVVKGLQQRA